MGGLIFILIVAIVAATPASAGDLASADHFFPIASRTDGLAGTRWSTALQVTNPQSDSLVVTATLVKDGAARSEVVDIGPGETRAWSDIMGELFGSDGNGAIHLAAAADDNPGVPVERRRFAAAMRIFTTGADGGSYGQSVPSIDPVTGFLGDWVATFPAVQSWGSPGVDGFRSNLMLTNIGDQPARVRARLFDAGGHQVWQTDLTIAPRTIAFAGLPRIPALASGSLTVDPLGEWLDCAAFVSVVDNRTGDAVYVHSQLVEPGVARSTAGEAMPDAETAWRRVRRLITTAVE